LTVPKHVALIGCGFSGTCAFYQLVDQYPVSRISIFEATGDFGPGYPYRIEDCPDYLINNTNDTMGILPSNRRAFVEWLRLRPDLAPDLQEKGHLPRSTFGHFLKDVFASTRTSAAIKGIDVDLLAVEVTGIRELPDGAVELSWNGGHVIADAAILTTGRCPEFDNVPRPPAGGAIYIGSHICTNAFDEVPINAHVHVLGASLSAYDVVNRLFSPATGCAFIRNASGRLSFEPGPNDRRVVMCSRSGRLKNLQSQNSRPISRTAFTKENLRRCAEAGKLSLATLVDLITQDAESNGAALDLVALADPYANCTDAAQVNHRAGELLEEAISNATEPSRTNFLVDLFRDAQGEVWDCFFERLLPSVDERLFRSKFENAAMCFIAPCPVETADKILALHRAERLSVIKGVREIRLSEEGCYLLDHDHGTETAKVLVNTTNAVNRIVSHPDQPSLIRALCDQGLLKPHQRDGLELPGAEVEIDTFRLPNTQNIYLANMMLWGPGIYTSSAFVMARIVSRLLSGIFTKETANA
jgi:uncharacterized NAD(P)/FAD-binding protein YdhS